MKGRISLTVAIACTIVLQAYFISASAQPANDLTTPPDTTAARENTPVHSFYAGAGYGSNMVYLGTTMSQDHGFGYTSLSYGLNDKLYLSATGYTISGFSPFLAFYSLG
ncbi:MAG: hypothetical protein ABR560_08370, partial [Bacteroidales bacterium]